MTIARALLEANAPAIAVFGYTATLAVITWFAIRHDTKHEHQPMNTTNP